MILTGMGPASELNNTAAKLFAGFGSAKHKSGAADAAPLLLKRAGN